MVGFKNTYLSPEEIFNEISYISSENIFGAILLSIIILSTITFILYIFPALSLGKEYFSREKQKQKRKNMIRQIAMQREIEEEIEKEL